MDLGKRAGRGRRSTLAGLLVMVIAMVVAGPALGDPSSPTGTTGTTGTTGPTIVCDPSADGCQPGPNDPNAPKDPNAATAPAPPATCRVSAATCESDRVLSNETTSTTWAYENTPGTIRQYPSTSAPRVATLHANTEDGLPEVYIVLRERHVGSVDWAEIRVPMRPNGRTGWVPVGALGDLGTVTTQLVINRAARQIRLYRGGHLVMTAPVGIGTPSNPTPAGNFWIREEFPVRGDPPYGPFAFGTSAYSTTLTDWPRGGVTGIHGTNQPGLIPGRPSHGCVRLRNSDIVRLSHLVPVGTPLLIE